MAASDTPFAAPLTLFPHIPPEGLSGVAALEELVAAGRITAVTFDTDVFSHYRYGFSRYPLVALGQLADRGVRIVLSSVVAHELKCRFGELARDTLAAFRRKLQTAVSIWNIDEAHNRRILALLSGSERRIDDTLHQALRALSVSVVNLHDYVPAAEAKYAKAHPQPEHRGHEGCPHVLLESLSAWARARGTHALVVSSNRAWLEGCAAFDNLHGVDCLKTALSLFHKECGPLARDVMRRLRQDDSECMIDELRATFRKLVRRMSFEPEWNATGHVAGVLDAVELIDIDRAPDAALRLTPVDCSPACVKFALDLRLVLEVYANVSLYLRERPDAPYRFCGTREDVLEVRQKGGVILVFVNEDGCWRYAGHEQPHVCETMRLDIRPDSRPDLRTDELLESCHCPLA